MSLIETLSAPFRKMRVTNATDASFPSVIPVTTEPIGVGDAAAQTTLAIHKLGLGAGGDVQNGCQAVFYAVGADNVTFSARCYSWVPIVVTDGTLLVQWVPILLCEVALTASTITGVAGSPVLGTERYADTVTLTIGNANVSLEILSPGTTTANSGIAHVLMDFKGPALVQWTFTTGGSATSCNGLFKPI